ncbi:Trm112 family protein [Hydrogenivirga sp. 128-5-R1-1]|uniref:Trm112 family protein n=1 Tax=Hydrogenivirga sp. 128-5-R1-1 TaxID=392423 RepID=UPI00015F37D4|nr:Trm112 family protein [Hydrogenivirga sp. 128-5-R1-1]EDP76431.1 hypothetical protein HG1285_02453 [Hydrogenivirga sp. 128-5-R1-1]
MLDRKLLEILACPVCKGDLLYEEEKDILVCERCGVYYEVKEGIPVLLPDSGKPLVKESP